jgi:hypothetical protein
MESYLLFHVRYVLALAINSAQRVCYRISKHGTSRIAGSAFHFPILLRHSTSHVSLPRRQAVLCR